MDTSSKQSLEKLLNLAQGDMLDPYEMLGLEQGASLEEVKKAYFVKVREFPPEQNPAAFKQIRAAYEALRTSEAKAATDLFALHPPPAYTVRETPTDFLLDFQQSDWLILARAYSDLGEVDFQKDYRDIKI